MSDTKPIDVVMKLHDLWNSGAIERIPEVYSPSFVAHMPRGWGHSEFIGHDGARQLVGRIRTAFPDWHERVVDVIADGERVVTRYVSTGTHTGFLGTMPPTERAVLVDEISIYLVQNYLVTEQWCLVDDLSFAQQLGLIPRGNSLNRNYVEPSS